MLAKRFSEFVISSRRNAIIMAVLFMMLPLLGWLGVAVIALVTLRKGAIEGFIVMLWAALPFVVLFSVMKEWWPLLTMIGLNAFVVWCLALVHRRFKQWSLTIELSALIGVIIVCCIHWFVKDIQGWWLAQMIHEAIVAHWPVNKSLITHALKPELQYITGIMIALVMFTDVVELILGDYFTNQLSDADVRTKAVACHSCERKGEYPSWTTWHLHPASAVILLIGILLAWFGPSIFKDILAVLAMPFLWAGLSLMHGLVRHYKLQKIFVAILYVLTIILLMFIPYVLALFVIIAILDSVFDFRKRLNKK